MLHKSKWAEIIFIARYRRKHSELIKTIFVKRAKQKLDLRRNWINLKYLKNVLGEARIKFFDQSRPFAVRNVKRKLKSSFTVFVVFYVDI